MSKQIIYYSYPKGTNRVAFTVTQKSVNDLIREGVIEADTATLTAPFLGDDMDHDTRARLMHIDKVKFDNLQKPTAVEFDVELLSMFYLDIYRQYRRNALNLLDVMESRALSQNKVDVIDEIQQDKQNLRDMPDNMDYSQVKTWQDVAEVVPHELLVNYEEKYNYRLTR